MRPELVVWDCDGVLVETERLVTRLEAEWITALGWPISQDEVVARFVGRSAGHMEAEIERHLEKPVPAGWHEALREASHELFRAELTAVEGVADSIDRLASAGLAMCVASSSSHDRLRLVLGITGLYERFAGDIHSVSEVERGKPAPDLFLHAARTRGVEPARCVVVEDSVPGVSGGVAAGMRVLGYGGGLTPGDRLAEAGAEVFQTMDQVPALLGIGPVRAEPT